MITMTLLLVITVTIAWKIGTAIISLAYRIKISNFLETISSLEDFRYIGQKDFIATVLEIFKRKGYTVVPTTQCGEQSNGFIINGLQYAVILEPSLKMHVEIETAMKLSRCMSQNSIFRGILITAGDFKLNTLNYCHKNVIQCINGEKLLELVHEVQRNPSIYETGKIGS